jgi:DNA repair exonuclease SbcCD ATPase subunit
LQDILYKKQQMAQLNERLEETELTLQEMVNSDAQKEIETLQQNIVGMEQHSETLQAQISLQYEEKEQLKVKFQESMEREQFLLLAKEQSENQVSYYEKEIEKLSQEIHAHQQNTKKISEQTYQEIEKCYLDVQAKQKEYENKALNLEQEIQKLQQAIEYKAQLLEQKDLQSQQLFDTHKQVQKQLIETQHELASLQRYQQNLPYAKGNTRKIESMYVQLREQFKEKSLQLDATRRELFTIQEEISLIKRSQEEAQVFDETLIDQIVACLFRDMAKECSDTENEIEQLYQLVDKLVAL